MFIAGQGFAPQGEAVPAAFPVALLMLAEGSTYGPAPPEAPKAAAKPATGDNCEAGQPNANTREIVICAQRSSGYRLNPDVVEAHKERRDAQAGRLKTPAEKMAVSSCGVGPMPCGIPGISLLGAALTAVEMAKRVAQGKEIGSMFKTTPEDDEYHLYLAAKQRREQRDAEAKAQAIAKAAQEAAAAKQAAHP
jgi:hypothetical protein